MTQKDDEIWAAYGKGVKTFKPSAAPPAPKPETASPVPSPTQNASVQTPPLATTMPEEWKKIIETEPASAPERPAFQEETPPAPPSPPPPSRREPLDLRVERNLSLGDVVIEARLDLHGQTEADAHEALLAFVEAQQKRGKRLVLVITGKGHDEKPSALRANVPRWCDVPPLAEKILAVRFAAPHHGGDGAYYILLRKGSR